MKYKKGFTLVELAVAIAISAITMTMLFSVVLSINAFIHSKEKTASYQSDLLLFKSDLTNVFEKYQESGYVLIPNSEDKNKIIFECLGENYEISFNNYSLYENELKLNEYEEISKVTFENKENLIKCVAFCGDEFEFVIILDKRV